MMIGGGDGEWGGIEIEAVHTFCVANQSNESCGNFSTG